MGRSFEYYWNRALAVFLVVVVAPFVVAVYSTGSLEMMLSILAAAGPLLLLLCIAGSCYLVDWIKGKGP